MTKLFCQSLKQHHKVVDPEKSKKWLQVFKTFLQENDISKQRFKKVLIWFTRHMDDKYTPLAYHAGMFCSKFNQIEDAYKRHLKDTSPIDEDFIPPRNAAEEAVLDADSQEIGIDYYDPNTYEFLGRRMHE
jgi:hypothetical protein